ncbi:MAG TPA: hypothetical protein VG839_01980 [Asticcacaulis sp.]|nr:hypothetical protein [Asticcacaulis sp.]
MRYWGWVLAVLAMVLAAPAQATTLTPKAWKIFIDESMAQYGDPSPVDFEYQLYQAAKAHKSQDAIIADFARRIQTDPARAQDYAELIVDAVVCFRQNDYEDSKPCEFAPGSPIYGETARIAMAEPTGGLLQAIGEMINDQDTPALVRLAWNHRAAEAVFSGLYGYNENSVYFAAMLLKLPDDPTGVALPVLRGNADELTPDEANGFIAAIEEAAEARLGDTPAALNWRAALAQALLQQELNLGLNHEAVTRYLAYPQAVRDRLPYAPPGLQKYDLSSQTTHSYAFANALAAALWLEGRRDEARAVLGKAYPGGWKREKSEQAEFDAVSDALLPKIAASDLFKAYVVGDGKPEADDGWLSGIRRATPAVREVVALRLTAAGYADIAAFVRRVEAPGDNTRFPAVWPSLTTLLPAAVTDRQPGWAERIRDARARQAVAADAASGPVHVTSTSVAPAWSEKPLPTGVTPWRDSDKVASLPKGLKLPVAPDDVLRFEANGKDAALVFESSEYDLSGEIPAAGLWVTLRQDGVWQKPLYLGLQEHFPYVVTSGSRLPLLAGDHLHLEIQVKEIDPKTITFPPVGMGYAREADGLYLDIDLAALKGDRDGDGLTDIAEARLGLKPDAADSDGDGIPDGRDPLPLTAYNPKGNPRDGAVAKIILEHFAGHDAGAIMVKPRPEAAPGDLLMLGPAAPQEKRYTMILVSDVDLFSDIAAAPFQLIVYSHADLARLGRDKAPFYPPRITELFRSLDGNDYYVSWSASWVGGSFWVHCDGDQCTSKELSNWIT